MHRTLSSRIFCIYDNHAPYVEAFSPALQMRASPAIFSSTASCLSHWPTVNTSPSRALPSEPDLVARYRVSRTTVRRALQLLEQEGRILRRRGSGTYAKTSRVHTSPRVRRRVAVRRCAGDRAASPARKCCKRAPESAGIAAGRASRAGRECVRHPAGALGARRALSSSASRTCRSPSRVVTASAAAARRGLEKLSRESSRRGTGDHRGRGGRRGRQAAESRHRLAAAAHSRGAARHQRAICWRWTRACCARIALTSGTSCAVAPAKRARAGSASPPER